MSRVKADKPQANGCKRAEGEQQEENGRRLHKMVKKHEDRGGCSLQGWNQSDESANVWLSRWAKKHV